MKRVLVVGIVLLFLGSGIPTIKGNNLAPLSYTLYVGGTGPGNYTRIQDAINVSVDGGTIFVYNNSSPYHESIQVIHSVTLLGEDQETTIIDEDSHEYYGIRVLANQAIIRNFTIENSLQYGVDVMANNDVISCLSIFGYNQYGRETFGIKVGDSIGSYYEGVVLANNTIFGGQVGIFISHCFNTTIMNNTIKGTDYGLSIDCSFHSSVIGNRISNSTYEGIGEDYGGNSIYTRNLLFNNTCGLTLFAISYTKVVANTFLDNNASFFWNAPWYVFKAKVQGFFENDPVWARHFHCFGPNLWLNNYWGKPRFLPYPIHGQYECIYFNWVIDWIFPVVTFDWSPARTPYDLPITDGGVQ
jgi:parallel beta-helix repeat protein